MKLSEKTFQVMEALDNQQISNQRHISTQTGVSLGQVNYLLKNLINKGLVKLSKFHKNPNKSGYIYLLTSKGIEAKSRVAVKFVSSKLKEYHHLRQKINEKLEIIEQKGHFQIIFIGPEIVKDSIVSIIKENSLKLVLVGFYDSWEELIPEFCT